MLNVAREFELIEFHSVDAMAEAILGIHGQPPELTLASRYGKLIFANDSLTDLPDRKQEFAVLEIADDQRSPAGHGHLVCRQIESLTTSQMSVGELVGFIEMLHAGRPMTYWPPEDEQIVLLTRKHRSPVQALLDLLAQKGHTYLPDLIEAYAKSTGDGLAAFVVIELTEGLEGIETMEEAGLVAERLLRTAISDLEQWLQILEGWSRIEELANFDKEAETL